MGRKSGRTAPKTKQRNERVGAYQKYAESPQWKILEKAIDNLVKNRDLIEQTSRDCIIGYLVKSLATLERNERTSSAKK